LVKFGALHKLLVLDGEIYRLITSMFLHIGVIHLLFNIYVLYVIGSQIENFYGKVKYLIIYFISGIIGGLFSCVLSNSLSAGASGAIFGLLGSLLYFGYNYRVFLGNVLKSQIIPLIIINLGLDLLMPNIDIWAHIGGLIGGFLISMAVGVKYKSTKQDKINGIILTTILTSFMIFLLLK
ncbi:MAG: rhomboid family intramembrane serine protease, partial [Clostridia bacterium]|nr:rhomboid family intramembrane serine protease [Clostridia bacterium]